MKFLIFNLTLIAIALAIARQMGITIPQIPAPCTKEFALIIAAQALSSYFSFDISRLLTEQPKRYPGDEDGILDAKVLENKRKQNQGILLLTTGFITSVILLAHIFCQNGPWTGFPPDEDGRYVAMFVFSMLGEMVYFVAVLSEKSERSYSDADLKRTLDAHHRIKELEKDNWVSVDPSRPSFEEKVADVVRSWRIAKDHPEWVDVKSADGL